MLQYGGTPCPGGTVESYPAVPAGLLSTVPPGQRGCTLLETNKCQARHLLMLTRMGSRRIDF
jgi:hypothetical protein